MNSHMQENLKIKANEEYLRIRYGKNERIGEVEDGMDSRIKHDSTDNSPISAEKNVELIGEKLSTKRKKNFIKIVDYLNEHQTIKAEEMVKLLDKAPSTIREYLRILLKWGLLKSKGKTKDRIYIKNY